MNLITTTLSVSLAPLLLTTQAQASNVAVPIASAQMTKSAFSTNRNRGMSPEAVLRLKADVSNQLNQLFILREKLERAINRIQIALDNGEHIELPAFIINAAESNMVHGESTINVAKESFERILSAERVACRPALVALQEDTLSGLNATIETMKKVPELSKQVEIRKKTVVLIDESRMAIALNSDKIMMKAGMTREEKRRYILSHAS